MEYSPQDSLETRQSQYMQLLDGYPEAKGVTYDILKEDCRINPDSGKRMNDFVLTKAADRNIPADALTGILAASPLVQQMVEDKLPASVVLKELVEMTRNQYTQQLQRAQESIPTIQSVASSAYTVLKTAESALFSVTPLPLQGTKSFIQSVAAPLTVTALATKIPGIDQAINTTIGLASSFTSTAFSAIAGNAVAYFGHAAMSSMPSAVQQALNVGLPNMNALGALAGQSIASVSNAVSQAVVTGAADKLGQVLGGAGAAVTIGNTAIALGRKISYEVSSKGVLAIASEAKQTLLSTFERSKLVLAKAEIFVESVKEKLTGVVMSQENSPIIPENFDIGIAEGITKEKVDSIGNNLLSRTYAALDGKRQDLNELNERVNKGERYLLDQQFYKDLTSEYQKTRSEFESRLQDAVKEGKYTPAQQTQVELSPNGKAPESFVVADALTPEAISSPVNGNLNNGNIEESSVELPSQQPQNPIPIDNASEPVALTASEKDQQFESSFREILNNLTGGRANISNSEIRLDGETVFKLKSNELEKLNASDKALEMVQKALNEPRNLEGDVKISIGSQVLLWVKNGEVKVGHGLIKESLNVEVATNEKKRYDELASPIRATGYEKTKQITTAAFAAGDKPEAIQDMLSKYDKPYQDFQAATPAMNERMLLQAEARVANAKQEGKAQTQTVERTPDLAMSV